MSPLEEVAGGALPRLRALSEDEAARRPAPGVWSAKQILGHLIDSAANNHARFVRAGDQDGLSLPGYDQDVWVAAGGYQERPWLDVLALWEAYQLQLAHVISRLSPAQFAHTLSVGEGESVTLGWLAEDYVRHQLYHLAQVWERAGA